MRTARQIVLWRRRRLDVSSSTSSHESLTVTDLRARRSTASASGHPWIYRATSATCTRGGRRPRRRSRTARPGARPGALQRPVADRASDADATATQPADDALIRAAHRGGDRVSRVAGDRRDRPTGSFTARPTCCPRSIVDRYGDYLVVQTLSQGMDRLTPLIVATLERSAAARRASSRATIRGRALLEGLEQRVEVLAGDVPESVDGRRERRRVRRRPPARPEDGTVSRPAREPRGGGAATRAGGCSTASATTAASR